MKCPIPIIQRGWPSGDIIASREDCLKEDCAKWDPEHSQCGERTIANALVEIVNRLGKLIDAINTKK